MQNDFQKTEAAFLKLDEVLDNIEKSMEKKQEQLRSRQSNVDQRINASLRENEQLKADVAEIAQSVEDVINHLDKVLNEDVTSNHND